MVLLVAVLWAWPSALFMPVLVGLERDSWPLRGVSILFTLGLGLLLSFFTLLVVVLRPTTPRWLAPASLVGVVAASFVVIPSYLLAVSRGYLGGLGGDRGEMLEIAWSRLRQGVNPYTYVNEGGAHISNLPGDIVLGGPAVLLTKNAGVMTSYVLPLTTWLVWWRDRLAFPILTLSILLAPAFWADTLSRGELVTTALLTFALGLVTLSVGTSPRHSVARWLWPIALGIAASTRITNLAVVLLVAALIWSSGRQRVAVIQVLIAAASFLFVTVPFYLWNPSEFGAMTAQLDHSGGLFGTLGIAVTLVALIVWGARSQTLRRWRPIASLALLVSLYSMASTIFPMIAQPFLPPNPLLKIVGIYVSGYAVLALTAPLILLAYRPMTREGVRD